MAEKWIGEAVQRKGRVRRLLRLKPGEKVTPAKVERKRVQLRRKGQLDRSVSSALSLAERFSSGDLHGKH